MATWFTHHVLGLTSGRFVSAGEFFIYDTVKVLLLLTLVVFVVGIVRSYLTTGLVAIVAGWVIGRLKLVRFVEDRGREVRMGDAAKADDIVDLGGLAR